MKTAGHSLAPTGASEVPHAVLLDSAQRQLDSLRAAVDERLAALEEVLLDPERHNSLETLLYDLSRLATEEAQATASRACVGLKLDAERHVSQARKAFQTQLEQEQATSGELRRALDRAEEGFGKLRDDHAAELRALREQYEAKLADERHASAEIERMAADLERRHAAADQTLAAERRTVEELRGALDRHEQTIARFRRDLAEARAAADQAMAKAADDQQRVVETQKAHAETQAQLAAERAANTELRGAMERLKEKLNADLEKERARAGDIQRAFKEAEARLAAEQSTAAELRRSMEQSHQQSAALSQQDQQTKATIDALKADLHHAHERLSDLARDNEEAAGRLETAHTEAKALRAEKARLEEQLGALGRGEKDAASARDQMAADLAKARQQIADLTVLHKDTEGRLAAERDRVDALKKQIADAEHRVAMAGRGAKDAIDANTVSSDELAKERERADKMKRARDAVELELKTIHADLQSKLDTERRAAQEMKRALDQAEYQLNQANQKSQSGQDDLHRELESARADAQATRSDLKSALMRIDDLVSAQQANERKLAEMTAAFATAKQERELLLLDLEVARSADSSATAPPSPTPAAAPAIAAAPQSVVTPSAQPAGPGAPATHNATGPDDGWTSVPLATRYAFPPKFEVQINGNPGWLRDLSVVGCQILAPGVIKPGQTIKLQLPGETKSFVCSGKVVWAQLEPPSAGLPLSYRAGVEFTKADEKLIDAFTAKFGKPTD